MATLPRIGRIVAVGCAAAALSFGLAGCSSSVAADDVEQEIDSLVQQQIGQPADEVDCPEDLPAEVGASIRCTLTAEGETYGVSATITSIQDDTANFDIKVDDQPQG